MAQFDDKLNSILSNPQLMQQLQSMARSLEQSAPTQDSKEEPAPTPSLPDPALLQTLAGISGNMGADADQQALLNALIPYLDRRKLQRLEKAMQAAKMARMASAFLGNGGLLSLTGR